MGLGFGMRPPPGSGSARITRNYPSRVQEGIWVWVWDWVLGLGNISRILENVADLDVQYFQDGRKYRKYKKITISRIIGIKDNSISNISRILENVADLVVH